MHRILGEKIKVKIYEDQQNQWRSQLDNLVPLCKFEVIIIIHSLEIDSFHDHSQ